jgi:hypothetical protein
VGDCIVLDADPVFAFLGEDGGWADVEQVLRSGRLG